MDDRVKSVAETIVPAGRFIRLQAKAPRDGVFFCAHEGLEVLTRKVTAGVVNLTAVARPGFNHVRVAAGEVIGVVWPEPKPVEQHKPSRAEVNGHGKEKR